MKIGIYCTNNYSYPLPDDLIYANYDVAVSEANTLSQMGEDVTLFAPVGTKTLAKLVTFDMLPYSDSEVNSIYSDKNASFEYENLMITKALNFAQENNFDIFQTHCRPFSIINFAILKKTLPIVVTIHDPLTSPAYKILPLYNEFNNLNLVTLTQAQQEGSAVVNFKGVVHNGIDTDFWKFGPEKGKYLLYCGRIMPEKGADLAVQIAIKSGLPLMIMGNPNHAPDGYFEEKIQPFLSDKIQFLGSISREKQIEIYQNALALLVPIRWPEPFGLVMIEANSCGVPIIASNKGSVPEIVKNGKNGFIVEGEENIDGFIDSISKVESLNRNDCRQHVIDNFSLQKMTQKYLELYKNILKV